MSEHEPLANNPDHDPAYSDELLAMQNGDQVEDQPTVAPGLAPVKSETYEEIFDKAGIPTELRGPNDHRMEVVKCFGAEEREYYPVPTVITINTNYPLPAGIRGGRYQLTQNGAVISTSARVERSSVGSRTVIEAGAQIVCAQIGKQCLLDTDVVVDHGAIIDHEVIAMKGARVGPGSSIGLRTVLGRHVLTVGEATIGANCNFGDYSRVGTDALVGDGVITGERVSIARLAEVEAGSAIGDFGVVGPRVRLARGTLVDPGATVPNNKHIRKPNTRVVQHAGRVVNFPPKKR